MPAGSQCSRFSLPIAYHTGNQQVWIVENGTVSMYQRITQFTAFMDGTGRFRRDMTGYSSGKRKLFEQLFHTRFVRGNIGVDFAVGSFQIGIGHQAWSTVSWACNVDDVQVVLFDDAVEVYIN